MLADAEPHQRETSYGGYSVVFGVLLIAFGFPWKKAANRIELRAGASVDRRNGVRNHFAARGGELVHLVTSVCLVCGSTNERDKTAPRTT